MEGCIPSSSSKSSKIRTTSSNTIMKMERKEEAAGDGGSKINSKDIVEELEAKLKEKQQRLRLLKEEADLATFISSSEVDALKKTLNRLRESASLLEEDCSLLRSRQDRDRERIKGLEKELETKEKECMEAKIEKMKALDEARHWKIRYGDVQACANRLLSENIRLEKEVETPRDAPSNAVGGDDEDGCVLANRVGWKRAAAEVGTPAVPDGIVDGISWSGAEERKPARAAQKNADNRILSNLQRVYAGNIPSLDEEVHAEKGARELQNKLLKSGHPSLIRIMTRSHVSGSFWLNLQSKFCKEFLFPDKQNMLLLDEEGLMYEVTFLGTQCALSGGWRRFALDHSLELGDALVFELIEPTRFKVYIVKAKAESNEDNDG